MEATQCVTNNFKSLEQSFDMPLLKKKILAALIGLKKVS